MEIDTYEPANNWRSLAKKGVKMAWKVGKKHAKKYAEKKIKQMDKARQFNARNKPGKGQRYRSHASKWAGVSTKSVSGATTRQPSVKLVKRGPKSVTFKRKAGEHVSRKFRKKVEVALNGDKYHGFYRNLQVEVLQYQTTNNQTTKYLGFSGSRAATKGYFNPMGVMDAASSLWNNYTSIQDPVYAAGQLDPTNNLTSKIECLNAWVVQEYRNNSQRTYTIDIYECAPTQNSQQTNDPISWWQQCLNNDVSTGIIPAAAAAQYVASTSGVMFEKPDMCPSFRKMYKSKITRVVLDPGQTFTYTLQGPKNFVYDWTKMGFPSGALYMQKVQRHLFAVYFCDYEIASTVGWFGEDETAFRAIHRHLSRGVGIDDCLWPHLHGEAQGVPHISRAPNRIPSESGLEWEVDIGTRLLNGLRVANP